VSNSECYMKRNMVICKLYNTLTTIKYRKLLGLGTEGMNTEFWRGKRPLGKPRRR
jgi:hypothetical protein